MAWVIKGGSYPASLNRCQVDPVLTGKVRIAPQRLKP